MLSMVFRRTLNKETWDRVGEVLGAIQTDAVTSSLWVLIKDAIDNEIDTSQALANAQEQHEELQDECLSERASAEGGTLSPKSQRYRPSVPYRSTETEIGDTEDELDQEEEADLEEGAFCSAYGL